MNSHPKSTHPWRRPFENHPNLTFWLIFLLFNCLLFLPGLLIGEESPALRSALAGVWRQPAQLYSVLAVWRPGPDLLRVHLEWLLLVALFVAAPPLRRRLPRLVLGLLYFLALLYAVYETVVRVLFQMEPIFYSQYRMMTEGFAYVLAHVAVPLYYYLLAVGVVVLLVWGLRTAIGLLTSHPIAGGLSGVSRALLALLVLMGVGQALRHQQNLSRPEAVVSSLAFKVQANVAASEELLATVRSFDDSYVRQVYDYWGQRLETTPNVYLIFIESYGSVLYKRPDWLGQYTRLSDELEGILAGEGWYAASALSRSPTWGGGSWMAYTSALFGLRIDSDPEYSMLLDRYQVDDFPDLASFLRGQGYRFYGLSSIAKELSDEKWDRYLNFYGADRWLRYRDLAYDGPEYGWGPSPPDQYSLNKARWEIAAETEKPYLFFTITQNSHYPWAPTPGIATEWADLSQGGADPPPIDAEGIEHSLRRQNYFDAVEYDLRVLVDFILNEEDPNALFVLVGDHQPPRVSRKEDGWETPIHVISRNPALIGGMALYGFEGGLNVTEVEPSLHHAGIHSLVARLLLEHYGAGERELPAFLADGVPFLGGLTAQSEEGRTHP